MYGMCRHVFEVLKILWDKLPFSIRAPLLVPMFLVEYSEKYWVGRSENIEKKKLKIIHFPQRKVTMSSQDPYICIKAHNEGDTVT